jgi:molybdate transport system regulatory protein
VRLGPGKVRLLEEIAHHGSISAAGRAMEMSYRRAWLLVDDLNSSFCVPAVATRLGGVGGGNASVARLGSSIIRAYRGMEGCAAHLAPSLGEADRSMASNFELTG